MRVTMPTFSIPDDLTAAAYVLECGKRTVNEANVALWARKMIGPFAGFDAAHAAMNVVAADHDVVLMHILRQPEELTNEQAPHDAGNPQLDEAPAQ